MARITILIADDHRLFREGLARVLGDFADLTVVATAPDGDEAVALASRLKPDVALVDVRMPGLGGPDAARRIRQARPETGIIMLTVSERDDDLFAAISAGARGYLLKSAETEELVAAIRKVHAGEAMIAPAMAAKLLKHLEARTPKPGRVGPTGALTEREIEVLRLVARGLPNKQIAATLGRSEHTIKTHLRHILDKLHMKSRAQAAAYAVRAGLVDTSAPDD